MNRKFDYDLIVIGTGAGGGVAAHGAARAGKKVAVVEAEKVGGECPNFGCVPTKALLQAAETYTTALEGKKFGINSKPTFDYAAIKAWKDKAVLHTGTEEGESVFSSQGIKLIYGYAQFVDKWTISVGDNTYTSRKFLIATGTKSVIPPIPGLAEAGFLTYREAIELVQPPKSLFVLGGGAIGCEFAQLFSSFGTQVTIADMTPRLIALEDPEVGDLVGSLFEAKGIKVHANARVTRIETNSRHKIVHFEVEGSSHQATVEHILLASGKAPNTNLGLENAGVKFTKFGISVDKYMRTSSKHIYAAGDVVGPYRFTHTASYQSRIAINNILHSKKKVADYTAVPRCVFVEPEVACVGMTEQQLQNARKPYQVGAVPISVIGRSNTSDMSDGFVKILATPKGVLLGASIVSPRAGEMIHELTLAIQHRLTARAITDTIHAFPTWSEAVRAACNKIITK